MKTPKRAKKCQQIIDQMVDWLNYYMGSTDEFRKFIRSDVQYLEDYLNEISEEHKIHNIRFASKLKAFWKKELEAKEKKITELEQKVEELSD